MAGPGILIPREAEPAKGYPPKRIPDEQIAGAAFRAGFMSGDPTRGTSELIMAVAIALAESGGNMLAHNRVPPDDSYGLWQINMIGDLGPSRRDRFGLHKNNELYDPQTNAKAAKAIKDAHGWEAWSTYKSGKYAGFLPRAKKAVLKQTEPIKWQSPFNDTGGIDQGEALIPGADPLSLLGMIFQPLLDFIKGIGLQVAGFIGGGVLIILAVVLYVRKTK
jgi:hypothetical protein